MTQLAVIVGYLALLLALGAVSARFFRGTSQDYFVASRSIGPFLLLMSLFGTTMTAFALVGSTGKAYTTGVGVYGMMASWSGLVHSAVFLLVGTRLWSLGKRYGYVTQVQYFNDRFGTPWLGRVLLPILVALVVPYLLIGLLGAGVTVASVTKSAGLFTAPDGSPAGVPAWITSGTICLVVYTYVFLAGLRGAAWANAFQTMVFIVVGLIAFVTIADALGGAEQATARANPARLVREGSIGQLHFLSYVFVPLSVGMFPHLFQHWLTARSAATFKASVVLHPVLIALVWVPTVLLGVWATGVVDLPPDKANAVLGIVVARLSTPAMSGLVTAGILAAIMSSLDSQFMCLGTMFTQDVVLARRDAAREAMADKRVILIGRLFVGAVVVATWLLSLVATRGIFNLGVWCFSGFAGLFPLVVGSLYWRRATGAGAIASVLTAAALWVGLFVSTSGSHGEPLIAGLMPVTFIVAGSALAFFVVSLMTQPPDAGRVARFFTEPA